MAKVIRGLLTLRARLQVFGKQGARRLRRMTADMQRTLELSGQRGRSSLGSWRSEYYERRTVP